MFQIKPLAAHKSFNNQHWWSHFQPGNRVGLHPMCTTLGTGRGQNAKFAMSQASKIETHTLRQRQGTGVVNGVGHTAHISPPGV